MEWGTGQHLEIRGRKPRAEYQSPRPLGGVRSRTFHSPRSAGGAGASRAAWHGPAAPAGQPPRRSPDPGSGRGGARPVEAAGPDRAHRPPPPPPPSFLPPERAPPGGPPPHPAVAGHDPVP